MVNALHLYSAFIQSTLQFMPLIHPPMAIGCHARHQPAHQEQLGVRCLAQGHFDTPRVGLNRQPSNCQMTALTSWAISPLVLGAASPGKDNSTEPISVMFSNVGKHVWRDLGPFLHASFISFGLHSWTVLLNSDQMFSIGFKSGDWVGHCKSLIMFSQNHFCVEVIVLLGPPTTKSQLPGTGNQVFG